MLQLSCVRFLPLSFLPDNADFDGQSGDDQAAAQVQGHQGQVGRPGSFGESPKLFLSTPFNRTLSKIAESAGVSMKLALKLFKKYFLQIRATFVSFTHETFDTLYNSHFNNVQNPHQDVHTSSL